MTVAAAPPAGIYLHLPFCSSICPYCDFAVVKDDRLERSRYVDRLISEIELSADLALPSDTIYLGGGTPSALTLDELARILAAVRRRLPVASDPWIAMEVNPEDVSVSSTGGWRQLGVRRLSLGVQAFDSPSLKFLGRRHGPEQARGSVEIALNAGFDSVSVDLIYGLPRGAEGRWLATLEEAVGLAPDHLSCYELTVHDGTPFGRWAERGGLRELDDDRKGELFRFTHRWLEENGYPGYEVSNFARAPEHHSRHNRKYWRHTPYLGLGLGAHSFDGRRRWWNERLLEDYSARLDRRQLPVAGSEDLSRDQLRLEAIMLGLRTYEGIELERFHERYGPGLVECGGSVLQRLIADGFVTLTDDRLAPTLDGLAVADTLARSIATESSEEHPVETRA